MRGRLVNVRGLMEEELCKTEISEKLLKNRMDDVY